MEPELIADYECRCGEGPLWHPSEQRFYWVDIPAGRLFRCDPATGAHELCYEGEALGGFTIQADGSLLLFMNRGAIRLWRDGETTTLLEEIPGEEASRFNDVAAGTAGRILGGKMR